MKKIILFLLTLSMCFTAFGGSAFAETTAAETAQAEKPAAEMSPEELYQAGFNAYLAGDYETALAFYQLAADAGSLDGLRGLGNLYTQGMAVRMDFDRGMAYYYLAADQGDAKSMYNLGLVTINGEGSVGQDIGKAIEYYEQAGDHGHADAFRALGVIFQNGKLVEQDSGRAAAYYQQAADLGDTSVCYILGTMYARGEGVEQDSGRAAAYYQQAAEAGSAQALCALGMMCYRGEGAAQDYGQAVHYFTQAAEQKEPTAMFALGECLRLGQGLEKDADQAAEWYRKALRAGYDPEEEEREMLKAALGDDYVLFFPVPAEGKDYSVMTAGVLEEKEQIGSMDLRFYPSAPHVPYSGMKAFVNFMYQTGLTVTPLENGVWEVDNPNGTKILVNPSAGTIEAADWAQFQLPPLPYTTLVGLKDTSCGWMYYSEVVFDDPPASVTFDFAKYGIPVYADEEDVYLPLELLSTMFTDVACNSVLWNGMSILKLTTDLSDIGFLSFEWYEGRTVRSLLTGGKQREEDVIREDYAELCFSLDYFYGHPGSAILDSGISEKGLDAALDDVPELASIKDRLKDPDMLEYMLALNELFDIGLNEGHSSYYGINAMMLPDFPFREVSEKLNGRLLSTYQLENYILGNIVNEIKITRNAAWGDEVYRECGSTAILRIDDFCADMAGWEAYYAGKGEIPMDGVGILQTGLKRASENPAIKNILFDLTANRGGSADMLMYMTDLIFGENVFRGYNVMTGQHEHAVMHSDKNLDGVFDEKDEEVKYDFNYAVLTSRCSFSAANAMPFMMQEHGGVILGERSGGGACCIEMVTLTNGGEFVMSGWYWALQDANGESLEDGCRVDLPIERIEPETPTHEDPRLSNGDYTPYFDDVMLDRMINEWFEEQAMAPAA